MNTVIIILLIWMIVFLHLVWFDIKPWEWLRNKKSKREKNIPEETKRKRAIEHDLIGKSHVRISATQPVAAISQPVADIPEEGEEVNEKDVTFALPKQEKMLRQMTPEEEEEAFKSFTYSKEEEDYEDDYPAESYAAGLTCEEMERAVSIANSAHVTQDEELKAGTIFKEMAGTELIELLTRNNPTFKSRVRDLLDRCERMETTSHSTTDKGHKSFMIEESTDIDIRDFI